MDISNCVIENNVCQADGAGIYAGAGTVLTISNCIFNNNFGEIHSGAGIYAGVGTVLTINNCTFEKNRAWIGSGSGIYADISTVLDIKDCSFSENRGIVIFEQGFTTIKNCLLINNNGTAIITNNKLNVQNSRFAYNTRAIFAESSDSLILKNCIIDHNSYGIEIQWKESLISNCVVAYNDGIGIEGEGNLTTLKNSIVYFNASIIPNFVATYCNIQGGFSGQGNIDLNPLFADTTTLTLSEFSPCIDGGDPDPVFDDLCFPPSHGSSRNDMGTYGGPGACDWSPMYGYTQLSVIPHSLNFGNVGVGRTAFDSISISNTGTFDLNVGPVRISGQNPTNFIADTSSFTLKPDSIKNLPISFSPDSADTFNAILSIFSNGGNDSVNITGNGVVPEISVTPDSLHFGDVIVFSDSIMLLIVSNQGGDTLNVNTTEISGIDSLQFSIFSGHAPFSIPPGGNPDTIQIQFSPTSIGTKTANMQIISNDSDENRIDISLNGTGVVPDIAIDPDTLNFDSVFVLIDTTLSVSVTNQGSGNLIVNTTNIIGIDSAQFSITSGQAPFTILPGGNPHIIEIQLIPISYGVINADLRIVSNDPNKNPIDIHLIAVGVASDISINPDSLNFGNVLILQDSLMSISVSNTGNSTLDVDSTQIVGADSNQFSLITGQGSFTVPPDSSHIIEVKFSPTSVGTKMADLRITSNDPDETPLDVPLMGTGIQPGAPEIVVNPDSLSFGNVLVSADSIRSVLVSNFGNEDLQVASTEILGMDSIQFSIIRGQAPFTVPAGGDPDTIQIKFSPTSAGFKIASLQITSNDPDENPFDVPLNGSGFEVPDISVNPDSLNFGNVLILQD
jgi:hypothetical protein